MNKLVCHSERIYHIRGTDWVQADHLTSLLWSPTKDKTNLSHAAARQRCIFTERNGIEHVKFMIIAHSECHTFLFSKARPFLFDEKNYIIDSFWCNDFGITKFAKESLGELSLKIVKAEQIVSVTG